MLNLLRFTSIMLTAVAMAAAFAHLRTRLLHFRILHHKILQILRVYPRRCV